MTPSACPHCGKSPVEITTMSEATPSYVPSCPCYPHPPVCVSCSEPLVADRCPTIGCPVYDVVQVAPLTDPLYGEEYAL